MPRYIFTEDEWMQFKDESHGHTLLAIDQTTYRSIKMGGMTDRLPGSETYDRLLGVNVFKPGGIYEAHAHQTPMYYYVIAGEGIMRVGDEERVVGRGAWIYTLRVSSTIRRTPATRTSPTCSSAATPPTQTRDSTSR